MTEGPPLDLAQRFANIMLLFLMSIFYFPLIPYMPLITFLAALYQFWIVKLMILYVHKRPEMFGSSIAHFFANSIPYFMLLYGASNFFWLCSLRTDNEVGVVSLFTCVAYIILPVRTIIDKFMSQT